MSFTGFIVGLYFKEEVIQFTTYNFSKMTESNLEKNQLNLTFENNHYSLRIRALRKDTTELVSPIGGLMKGRVQESLNSELHIELFSKKEKRVVFQDTGKHAGLEITGKVEEITRP
jgi:hypothetical protein